MNSGDRGIVKFRRLIAKMAIVLMVFGVGSLAAVIPASSAAAASPAAPAACTATTGITGPTKNGSVVNVVFRINVAGCSGRYWTEYSNIAGPGASDDGRTQTYRGDRNYSLHMTVPCRTGTYKVYLKIIGDGFDGFREASKYIRC